MEFWTRLIRGAAPPKKAQDLSSPQVRLAQFKRAYNNLLKIWHNGNIVSTDSFAAENARICLHRLAELLAADQRGPTPHLCVSFAATSRLLVTVARLSAAFESDGVTHEALGICGLLIDSEEEAFLEDRAFANHLSEFVEAVQRCAREIDDPAMESSLVELLLFGIAAKLRVEPHVLRVWFQPERPDDDDEYAELSDSERRTRFEEFPLFYLLLQYVSADGRAGEFGRMGLLYLIETVGHSEELERWIIDGDMAALMASSLGALYSQLSRKLAINFVDEDAPAILKFSDRLDEKLPPVDVELTTSPEHQSHLSTFLALLKFWQDLLEHCPSKDVKQTLLDHFQYLFLQQLLYPSLLQSSDVDGGSAVAVLTYLRHILSSIDDPDLVRVTFQYLFGHEISLSVPDDSSKPISRARRRKSQSLVARMKPEWEEFTPGLFSLTDLITTSLLSYNQQVLSATLQLFSGLLRRPHHEDIPGLLRTRPFRQAEDQRTAGAHEQEVDKLLTLAENVTAFQDLESSYENHIHDNRNILETHPCSIQLLNLPALNKGPQPANAPGEKILLSYSLLPEDTILRNMVSLLEKFFRNEVETNLNLTQVIIDLASCGYLRIEGWLVTHPSRYTFKEASQEVPRDSTSDTNERSETQFDIQQQLRAIALARRHPIWDPEHASPVYSALLKLLTEAETYQRDIEDFDAHLLECRNVIEGIEVESALPPPPPILPSPSRSPTRRGAGVGSDSTLQTESISERLKSDRAFGSDVRGSPMRGRDGNSSADAANAAALSGGRVGNLRGQHSRANSQGSMRDYSSSPVGRNKAKDSSRLRTKIGMASAALARRITLGGGTDAREESELEEQEVAKVDGRGETDEDDDDDEVSDVDSEDSDVALPDEQADEKEDVSLGQLLANMVILQEFILELAALIEVRASLFGEVKQM